MIPRLVQFSNFEGVETPLAYLARLRAIVPAVELVYVGEGVWWVGRVLRTDARSAAADAILANEARRSVPNPRNLALAHLAKQGFARIQAYTMLGNGIEGQVRDADGFVCTIEHDLAERWRHYSTDGGEAHVRERMGLTDGSASEAAHARAMQAYMLTDGLEHYRRTVRDRKSFGAGGMTGGLETYENERRTAGGLVLPAGVGA